MPIPLIETFDGLKQNRSLMDLIQKFQDREALDNEDQIVELSALRVDDRLNVIVPGMGKYQMSGWARSQVSTIIGVKFDRWFSRANSEEQAFELNRRFSRGDGQIKVRTTLINAGENGSDGTLHGIVSPNFAPIKDSSIAEMVLTALRGVETDFRIIRTDTTDKSVSWVVGVGKPFIPGGSNVVDQIWGGLSVRNSGVGYASVSITMHLTRLACTNGLALPVPGSELLRKRHTSGLTIDRIWNEVSVKFLEVPGKLRIAGQVLANAQNVRIENPEETIGRILIAAHLPKRLAAPILAQYQREDQSAFGLSQALTDSGMLSSLQVSPEERQQIEVAAGEFLRNSVV